MSNLNAVDESYYIEHDKYISNEFWDMAMKQLNSFEGWQQIENHYSDADVYRKNLPFGKIVAFRSVAKRHCKPSDLFNSVQQYRKHLKYRTLERSML